MELSININDEEIYPISSSCINVMDFHDVQFFLKVGQDEDIEVYVEDYLLPLKKRIDSLSDYFSIKDKIFRESFGYSTVRIYIANELKHEIIFNVLTEKVKFEQIKEMVMYLLKNNNRVLDICLSRTKLELDNFKDSSPNIESVITLSEDILKIFLSKKGNYATILRKRLETAKDFVNESNQFNLDPYEIFNNISDIFPSNEPTSINIRGRRYSLDNIKRETLKESYNLEENHILIGGIYSIKNTLLHIKSTLSIKYEKEAKLTFEQEYSNLQSFHKNFTIDDLYLQVTTDGISKRIDSILSSVDAVLFELQKKLEISFIGYKYPKNTQFVKHSSFYRNIFSKLFEWYNLGDPDLGINKNLIKLRSTSKIYEMFCLYSFIESIYKAGWKVLKSNQHTFFKNFIPEYVKFQKDDNVLELFYEKTINPVSNESQHNDLVYLDHKKASNYRYYTPDFIFKKTNMNGDVKYFIFDSKYSSSSTLEKYRVLDELYRKYYTNLAVFNMPEMRLESSKILSIVAIHPFGKNNLFKWNNVPNMRIFPIVESSKLDINNNNFNKYIEDFESL